MSSIFFAHLVRGSTVGDDAVACAETVFIFGSLVYFLVICFSMCCVYCGRVAFFVSSSICKLLVFSYIFLVISQLDELIPNSSHLPS